MGQLGKKIESITRKGKTLLKDGLEPYEQGKNNFNNPLLCVEILAAERLKTCKGCECFQTEPNELFQVGGMYGAKKEDTLQELTNKSCKECGCILSYKIRQNVKKCKKWQK